MTGSAVLALAMFLSARIFIKAPTQNLDQKAPIAESVPTKAQPLGEKFAKFGDEYDTIFLSTIFVLNGKLAYEVQDKGDSYIVYDGKEIGREYDSVQSVVKIGEKLAFLAIKDRRSFIVYDGVELGKEYQSVQEPMNIGGDLGYRAQRYINGVVSWYGVYKGKEITEEYGTFSFDPLSADQLAVVDGKLAYVAQKGQSWFVVYDGAPVGEKYGRSSLPKNINGKLAYTAITGEKVYVVYDGKEIGKEYDSAGDPTELNGKLAYFAQQGKNFFVVYDGKKYGKEYDKDAMRFISKTPKAIGGKLAYEVYDAKAQKRRVIYDDALLGGDYDQVDYKSMTIIGGKLTYIAANEKESVVVSGDTIQRNKYDKISELVAVNDKVAFSAQREGKEYIVYDGQEYGGEFDGVANPTDVNGKLAFHARKGYKQFMMLEK